MAFQSPLTENASPGIDSGAPDPNWAPLPDTGQTSAGIYQINNLGARHGHHPRTGERDAFIYVVTLSGEIFPYQISSVKYIQGPAGSITWFDPGSPRYRDAGISLSHGTQTHVARSFAYEPEAARPGQEVDLNVPFSEILGGHSEVNQPLQRNPMGLDYSTSQGNIIPPQNWSEAHSGLSSTSIPNVEPNHQYRINLSNDVTKDWNHPPMPTIRVNHSSEFHLGEPATAKSLTRSGNLGIHGAEPDNARADAAGQASTRGITLSWANLDYQQQHPQMHHETDHFDPFIGLPSRQNTPTPEIAEDFSLSTRFQEPEMPDNQQATVGLPYAYSQFHLDKVRQECTSKGQRSRRPRVSQSASHQAASPGKSRGKRTGPLSAEQKAHANIVRNAGPKDCDCRHRKVKCTHFGTETPQSLHSHGSGTYLAATHPHNETAIQRELDTSSSQNTSSLTETTPVSSCTPSRNQSFENTTDFDVANMSLLTENYQASNDIEDTGGDVDDEDMLEMGTAPRRLYH